MNLVKSCLLFLIAIGNIACNRQTFPHDNDHNLVLEVRANYDYVAQGQVPKFVMDISNHFDKVSNKGDMWK